MECWPRQANPATDKQYPGWPVKINQLENYNQKAIAYLPEIKIDGMVNPIIQVIDEENDEIIYTLRIKGNNFRPMVLKQGIYSIKIGEPGANREKVLNNITSLPKNELKTITVIF